MSELEWKYLEKPARDEDIKKVEEKLNVIFPEDYKQCIRTNHGARPKRDIFEVEGMERVFGALLMIQTPEKAIDILRVYENYKLTLPKNVIPFADDPSGNLICFDYKNHSENPIVVFWEHEDAWEKEMLMKEEGLSEEEAEEVARENIFYVADTFTEFLQKLHEDEED
ncbi:SMI1/KNR4 family protein [Priestia filamentosa]|uniref:SMI1/KNR4 family protein n=1 Tax=Priestia TaxID=2800373 RepID=UPI001FB33BAB|nr:MULTISPECIES: SMI1/KNR4 family protein [Priestia]MCY8232267.1 SMI1/KNR4 family protein [Priestia endophytica]UOE61900.1 SMI1/KNR4 family protein [Priestia filamentosa]